MKRASITVNVDPEFKAECDSMFAKMGISTADAVRMFLHQAVACQGFPFKPGVADDPITRAVERMPEAGRRNESGVYVLPADWNNPEDDVYNRLS